jgi:hypothetical protein
LDELELDEFELEVDEEAAASELESLLPPLAEWSL